MSAKQKLLCFGAALLLLSLLTGIWAGGVITGMFAGPDPQQALASHLEGLLNGMLLIIVALALDAAKLTETGKNLILWLMVVEGYLNWFVTGVSAFWHVKGLEIKAGDWHNNVIAVFLYVVVLTGIIAVSILLWGLLQNRSSISGSDSKHGVPPSGGF